MIIINSKSISAPEEIINKFDKFEDNYMPNEWNIFEQYEDPRAGLHVKILDNKIMGYYEDGYITTRGRLQSAKNFFWIRVRRKKGYSTIRGVIMCTPTLFVWLISFSLLQAFWMENVVECTAIEILLLLLGFGKLIFKEQPELREELERMYKE